MILKRPTKKIKLDYTPRLVQTEIHDALTEYRWSVIVAHRRLGKTVCMLNHLIKLAAKCKKIRPRLAYLAPQYNQAKTIAWDYLKHYTAPIPGIKRNEAELWVELPNGARIRLFGSDNPDALRGQYLDFAVLDEVAQMRSETWGEVIAPALIDRQGGACFIGTPKGINLFSELYYSGIRKNDWWCKLYSADKTGILSESDLSAAKDNMSDAQYRQEFLCDFGASGDDALISLDLANKARTTANQAGAYSWAPIVIGVDVARFGDDSSVIYIRQGLHTVDIQVYKDLDLMAFADVVANAIREYKPTRTYIDSVGIGAGLVDRLRQLQFSPMEVNGGSAPINPKYKNKRAECWGEMKAWLEAGGDIPDNPALVADLTGLTYTYDIADRLVLEKKSDARKRGIPSPDLGDSLALTFSYPAPLHERKTKLTMAEKDWMQITGQDMAGDNDAINMD